MKNRHERRSSSDRVEVPHDAFLRTTGQLWKLIVASVVLPWPAVLIGGWAIASIGPDQQLADVLAPLGVAVATGAAIVMILVSVRCPRCRHRTLLGLWSDPEGLNALTRLLKARTCAACGFAPTPPLEPGR